MDLSDTQPKLLDAEHAWGRQFQTEKSTIEVRGHVSTRSSTSSFQNRPFCFYYSIWCFQNKHPSHVCCRGYIMLTAYWNYSNIIRVFSNVFQQLPDQTRLFTVSSSKPIRGFLSTPPRVQWRLFTDRSLATSAAIGSSWRQGDYCYKNPKEGVLGFPIVLNISAICSGKAYNSKKCNLLVPLKKIAREMLHSVCKMFTKCTK